MNNALFIVQLIITVRGLGTRLRMMSTAVLEGRQCTNQTRQLILRQIDPCLEVDLSEH